MQSARPSIGTDRVVAVESANDETFTVQIEQSGVLHPRGRGLAAIMPDGKLAVRSLRDDAAVLDRDTVGTLPLKRRT